MPRSAAKVTQADLARAARVLRDLGVERVRVVFRGGDIHVEADDGQPSSRDEQLARRLKVVPL